MIDPASVFIADNARVAQSAQVGRGTRIWAHATVGDGAVLGAECVVGERAFIDRMVRIGNRCKIQNNAIVYSPAVVEDGVFIGPGAILTNDRIPRAITPEGDLAGPADWIAEGVTVRRGASIGAGVVVIAGVEIGTWAMLAAAALVNRPVAAHALMAGVPARRVGWVGRSGQRLQPSEDGYLVDPKTGDRFLESGDRLEELR